MITYTKLDDTELAALLRTGDEGAFKAIYQKYWEKLLVVAGRRLGDVDEAEETLQDIFLNLWKRRGKFHLQVSFDHYFAVAVKFEVINRLARRSKEQQRNSAYARESSVRHELPHIRFDLETLQRQLDHTINSLPPKCQLVFRMSRERGLTNQKIAQELDISEKAVEKHVTNALKTLKSRFSHLFPLIIVLIDQAKR